MLFKQGSCKIYYALKETLYFQIPIVVSLSLLLNAYIASIQTFAQASSTNPPNILLIMSDNQSWNDLGIYGNQVVRTPAIDAIAKQGIRFTQAFCAAPSCTPARAALLASQDIWTLGEGANLWGTLPKQIKTYPDWLEENGYKVGYEGKGWGPGNFVAAGRSRNPGGNSYSSFKEFLQDSKNTNQRAWSYWFSSKHPHRPFELGKGAQTGIKLSSISVPSYLPDTEEVRGDIADYYASIEQFDQQVEELIQTLKDHKQYENTVIVICSDNGWQMPRGLGNLYDAGTRVPLIISYPPFSTQEIVNNDLISLNDLAPTFLELAGIKKPASMTGNSLVTLLRGSQNDPVLKSRDAIITARERHAFVRQNGLGYPSRAIRTHDYLYIINYFPDRWPAGDPPLYGDVDAHMLHYAAPTKMYLLEHKENADVKPLFDLAFSKRPQEELYSLKEDPDMLFNQANHPQFQLIKESLQKQLHDYQLKHNDPRITSPKTLVWDTYRYYQERDFKPRPSEEAQKKLQLQTEYNYLD